MEELSHSPNWEAIITLTVTSTGRTGSGFIEDANYFIGVDAATVLRSDMFEATTGVTTRVVIFRGNRFTREQRLPNELRDFGFSKGLLQPKLEVAFLLAELLDQGDLDQMGVRRIMVMHRPLFVPGYPWNLVPSLLTIGAYEHEIVWLDARLTILNGPLSEDDGFAYVVPPDRAYV